MLAERVSLVLPAFLGCDELSLSLFHQVLSHLLRLLLSQRGFQIVVDEFLKLWRQFVKHSSFINHASPPVPLLWWDMGRRWNFDVWIHKEKRQQFAVAGSGCVVELERKNAVLKYVRENKQTTFACQDFT